MKKSIILIFALFTFTLVNAQGSKVNTAYAEYTHAVEYLASSDIEKAVKSLSEAATNIDLATTHEKTMNKSKTWRYRGMIYTLIAGIESMQSDYPDAIPKATVSFSKAKELDTKGQYEEEIKKSVMDLYNTSLQEGVAAYQKQEYEKSMNHFILNQDVLAVLGLIDSLGIYNAGLSADLAGFTDIAIESYKRSAALGYEGEYCYTKTIALLQNQKKYDEAIALAKEARNAYPDSQQIITAQLNVFLGAEMFEEAEIELDQAAQDNPDDPSMWFAIGVVKDNLNKKDEAIEAYKTSLEVDPDYYNSTMNLAILYFQIASKKMTAANEIDVREIEKYNIAKEDALQELKLAIPYFEKAYALKPENVNILLDLKEAYGQVNDKENYNRIKALIDSNNK